MYIQKCNNITNNSNKRIGQSLQVPKIKYGYQIKRKSSVSKINVARSNTNFYYEPWHVRNPDIIGGTFGTLKYSKVRRYLDPC